MNMNQKLLTLKNKNKGFILPYVMIIAFLVINIFIFTTLLYLGEKKLYNDKINYYQILILENRTKKHVYNKITSNNVENFESELIYYDEDFVYLTYEYNLSGNYWKVNVRINHNDIDQFAYIYFYLDDNNFIYKIR